MAPEETFPPSRKIGRLKSPKLTDVALGADVKPDILKDLLKVDVPDIKQSVDSARDEVASSADREIILNTHKTYPRRPWTGGGEMQHGAVSLSSKRKAATL